MRYVRRRITLGSLVHQEGVVAVSQAYLVLAGLSWDGEDILEREVSGLPAVGRLLTAIGGRASSLGHGWRGLLGEGGVKARE